MRNIPRPHMIFARPELIPSTVSPQGLGFVQDVPSRPWLPHEIPQVLVDRLIRFLRGSHPIPHKSLDTIIPISEAGAARREFHALLRRGLTPGEALIEIGLVERSREWHNVPNVASAEVLEIGCDCVGPVGTLGLVASSAGEPFADLYRIYRCSEFLGIIDPEAESVLLAA